MDVNSLVATALRAGVIYTFLLIVLRILGKRTIGNITALDLVVALVIGEVVAEPLYGQVPMGQAFIAVGVLAGLHLANSVLSCRFPKFDALVGGKPNVLIRGGQLQRPAMRAERVNEEELLAMLREHGIEAVSDVKLGVLETNGQLSVITEHA